MVTPTRRYRQGRGGGQEIELGLSGEQHLEGTCHRERGRLLENMEGISGVDQVMFGLRSTTAGVLINASMIIMEGCVLC